MDFSRQGYQNASCESDYSRTRAKDPGRYKDSNETNFDTDRRTCSCGLRGDIPNQIKHGKKGLHINCSGLSSSWDKCYASAANSCAPKGYKVIAKSGDVVEEPGDYPFGLNPAGYTSRSMIVICK
jgi:hypothetical protein